MSSLILAILFVANLATLYFVGSKLVHDLYLKRSKLFVGGVIKTSNRSIFPFLRYQNLNVPLFIVYLFKIRKNDGTRLNMYKILCIIGIILFFSLFFYGFFDYIGRA